MTTIDDLNTSITNMSTEELLQRITDLRKARRTSPSKPRAASPKPSKVTAKHSLAAILKNLPPEELEALLKGVENA